MTKNLCDTCGLKHKVKAWKIAVNELVDSFTNLILFKQEYGLNSKQVESQINYIRDYLKYLTILKDVKKEDK